MAKVLIALPQWIVENNSNGPQINDVTAMLSTMGYRYEFLSCGPNSTYITEMRTSGKGYAFVVVVYPRTTSTFVGTEFGEVFLSGGCAVPVMATYCVSPGAGNTSVMGVSGTGVVAYRYMIHNTKTLPVYAATVSTNSGQESSVTQLAAHRTTPADHILWKRTGSNKPTYCDAGGTSNSLLPFLVQQAVTDGHIAAPPRKLQLAFDIDDFPASAAYQADPVGDVVTVYEALITHGLQTANGIHGRDIDTDQPDWVWDYVAARTPDLGGVYWAIEHQGSTLWSDTYTNVLDFYHKHNAAIRAKGIRTGFDLNQSDSWGYHYFNTNLRAPDGLRVCSEMGMKVVRFESGTSYLAPEPVTCGTQTSRILGMLAVGSESPYNSTTKTLDPLDGEDTTSSSSGNALASRWLQGSWLTNGGAHHQVPYVHGGNFEDIAIGVPDGVGEYTLQNMGDTLAMLHDVVESVHPIDIGDRYGFTKSRVVVDQPALATVVFNGTDTWLADHTNRSRADTGELTLFCEVEFTGGDAALKTIFIMSTSGSARRFALERDASDKLSLTIRDTSNNSCNRVSAGAYTSANGVLQIIVSANKTASRVQMYVSEDGGAWSQVLTNTTWDGSTGICGLSQADLTGIGAFPTTPGVSVQRMPMQVGCLWFMPGVSYDLANYSDRARFVKDNGDRQYLGATGTLVNGRQPEICFFGTESEWTNRGSSGTFAEYGAITDV